jgi:hypothetical protein
MHRYVYRHSNVGCEFASSAKVSDLKYAIKSAVSYQTRLIVNLITICFCE